jgi:hypothetical protein
MMETTSFESYGNLKSSGLLTKQQHVVLQALKRHGASTASELTAAIQRERSSPPDPSWQKRLSELQRKGVVEKLPPRACRVTKNSAAVWRATSCLAAQGQPVPERERVQTVKAGESDVPPAAAGGQRNRPLFLAPNPGEVLPLPSSPGIGVQTERQSVGFSFCACGTLNVRECESCGPYCAAFGHAAHSCGGRR